MIRAILVDDEALAIAYMQKKLEEVGGVEVIATFLSGEALIERYEELNFQVAFLDIDMAGMSGIDLAEYILDRNPAIQIVFVTAHQTYAVKAFELNSVDYIVKPVLKDRLVNTVNRLIDRVSDPQTLELVNEEKQLNSLRINCMGEFSTYFDNQQIKWKTVKVEEVFAFLIMHHQTTVSVETILDAIWPESDYKRAKIYLHTSISYIRQTLKTFGFKDALIFIKQSYFLSLNEFYCDEVQIEQLVDSSILINRNNIEDLEEIFQLYKGSYMEKNDWSWAREHGQMLEQKVTALLERLEEYYEKSGEKEKRLTCLQKLFSLHPYSEKYLRQLMIHYIDIGERGETIRLYKDFHELLENDCGISPEKATEDIYKSIVQGKI